MPPEILNPVIEPVPPLMLVLARLGMAIILGFCVAAAHAFSTRIASRPLDRPFLTTLILLAVVIALVTIVIGNSAAKAFTLVGTLAIVRFRTIVEDTRDTAFVIFAVVAGLAAGNDYLVAPLVCIPFIVFVVWVLRPSETQVHPASGTLTLRLGAGKTPEPQPEEGVSAEPIPRSQRVATATTARGGTGFELVHKVQLSRIEEVLAVLTRSHRLANISTARNGTAFDLAYKIQITSPMQFFDLVVELTRIEGVQGVELKEN